MSNVNLGFGVKEITVNGQHTLRFNPNDATSYNLLRELLEQIDNAAKTITNEAAKDTGEVDRFGIPVRGARVATLMTELDTQLKDKLSAVFGGVDFDQVFERVNCFATTDDGEFVISGFINAITPEIQLIADQRMRNSANAAKLNREQRRAAQRR